MKILILNWRDVRHPRAGGAELRLQAVYAPLVAAGHEVILYCSSFNGGSERECIAGIEIYRQGGEISFFFHALKNMKHWIQTHQPDVVVEDLNKLPLYTPLFYKGPLLIQMHHLWGHAVFKEAPWWVALPVWLAEQSIRWAYKHCLFTVVSPSTARELQALGIGADQMQVIYNGADLTHYQPVAAEKKAQLVWIGRLQKYKGPIEAIQVLELLHAEFPDLELVILGDGPYRAKVKAYAAARALPVRLAGFVGRSKKIEVLQRAAVHIQTSWKEGWGLSIIEANACGCPVVAHDTAGLCDSVVDGQSGLLYRYGDIADAAAIVRRVLRNEALSKRLAAQGLERAAEFSWARNSQEIFALLERITQESDDAA